jgi:conjugal transfer mating pair stabilization protein TraG
MLFGGGFTGLMKQVTVISLLIVIIKYLLAPDFKSVALWFIQVLVVTSILVVPTARVHIHDKLPNSYGFTPAPRVVDDVPLGLAFMASITSRAGNFLMGEFEGAFSGTFSVNKRSNILFGSKIIEDTMDLRPENANIKATFRMFTSECLLKDVKAGMNRKNGYTVQDLKSAEDLLGFLAERTSKARRMYYGNSLRTLNYNNHSADVGDSYISCNKVAKIIKEAVEKETETIIPKMARGFFAKFFPKNSPKNFDQAFRNSLSGTYELFLGIAGHNLRP